MSKEVIGVLVFFGIIIVFIVIGIVNNLTYKKTPYAKLLKYCEYIRSKYEYDFDLEQYTYSHWMDDDKNYYTKRNSPESIRVTGKCTALGFANMFVDFLKINGIESQVISIADGGMLHYLVRIIYGKKVFWADPIERKIEEDIKKIDWTIRAFYGAKYDFEYENSQNESVYNKFEFAELPDYIISLLETFNYDYKAKDPDKLKQNYHKLVSQYHPDKIQHLGDDFAKFATEKTKEINVGYDLLLNFLKETNNV
jgi:hypothetical protein